MVHKLLSNSLLLYLFFLFCISTSNSLETKDLTVGTELKGETIPLNFGERIYNLVGLKKHAWYEIKISYPSSIPSSFSIDLKRDRRINNNRRLLNTEKIIFKSETSESVLIAVTVNAEGVVAKPNTKERELALFNIVCDELMLGIPCFAWWIGSTALLCLFFAVIFPYFFPLNLLLCPEKSKNLNLVKAS